jgi:hypothetical protein
MNTQLQQESEVVLSVIVEVSWFWKENLNSNYLGTVNCNNKYI